MTVFLPVWNSHCTRVRFTVIVWCSDELAIHSCPLLCLQKRVAKVASGLLYCWSLLRNNNMATNVQRFTLHYALCCMRLLNVHILTGNAARQWHANSGKPRTFILCEKKQEWVHSNASTSLNNPLLVRVWPTCLSVKLYLCRLLFMQYKIMWLVRIHLCRLVGIRLNR